jgi:hypothetical protein
MTVVRLILVVGPQALGEFVVSKSTAVRFKLDRQHHLSVRRMAGFTGHRP